MRHIAEEQAQAERGGDSADELREPVGDHTSQWEVAGKYKAERHSRIQMSAAEMSSGVDHGGDHQPKDQPDADMSDLPTRDSINHNGAAPGEDQHKRPDTFSDAARSQRRQQYAESPRIPVHFKGLRCSLRPH